MCSNIDICSWWDKFFTLELKSWRSIQSDCARGTPESHSSVLLSWTKDFGIQRQILCTLRYRDLRREKSWCSPWQCHILETALGSLVQWSFMYRVCWDLPNTSEWHWIQWRSMLVILKNWGVDKSAFWVDMEQVQLLLVESRGSRCQLLRFSSNSGLEAGYSHCLRLSRFSSKMAAVWQVLTVLPFSPTCLSFAESLVLRIQTAFNM